MSEGYGTGTKIVDEESLTADIDGGTPDGGETSLSGDMGDLFLTILSQLQDETGDAWPPSKIMPYADLAFQEILNLIPEAHPVETHIQLVAGAEQSYPDGTLQLLEAICNIESDDVTVGSTITTVKKEVMDKLVPNWLTFTSAGEVSYVVTDKKWKTKFFVFPPQPTTDMVKIKTILSTTVDKVTVNTSDFPFDASYKPAFVDYMIFRALSEETTIPNALNKANTFFEKFLKDLGLKGMAEKNNEGK